MSTVHFLNVGKGDCTLIEHASKHITVVDICKGNYEPLTKPLTYAEATAAALDEAVARIKGNFGMSKKTTNPISYLKDVGVRSVFRFILTHPDMDHLDGFDALLNQFTVSNYWDSGVRKSKPDFKNSIAYKEQDWDRYEGVCNGKEKGITLLTKNAGGRFKYANRKEDGTGGGDGLYILAPDNALAEAANSNGDVNDASYVLLYRSAGGRILIPGDAHDETWEYVIEHYKEDVENCSVLFAPHHGRKSGRKFDFLDVVKPKITFFGCASSGDLAYNAWSARNLRVVTNNQAGNIVMECGFGQIDVYVENSVFAEASDCDLEIKNSQGYVYFDSIKEVLESKA